MKPRHTAYPIMEGYGFQLLQPAGSRMLLWCNGFSHATTPKIITDSQALYFIAAASKCDCRKSSQRTLSLKDEAESAEQADGA